MENLEELTEFLFKAKPRAYASDQPPVINKETGAKEFFYKEGDWEYKDSFFDSDFNFHGYEIVKYKGKIVWMMSYHGEMIIKDKALTKETFKFLRQALSQPDEKLPIRGPNTFSSEGFDYFFQPIRNIERFTAKEAIHKDSKKVYILNCIGGLL